MRAIESNEVEQVSGGILPALIVLGFVAYNAEKIESFVNGFFDGLSESR
jgi:hypothetical protein